MDWQRVRARPARLLMPVLTFLTPILRLPLAGLDRAAEARVATGLLVPMLALLTPALRLPLTGLDRAAEARVATGLLVPVLALLTPVLRLPLAGLDQVVQEQVAARLERHRAGGGSAILVTHQPLDLAFDLQRVLAIDSA